LVHLHGQQIYVMDKPNVWCHELEIDSMTRAITKRKRKLGEEKRLTFQNEVEN